MVSGWLENVVNDSISDTAFLLLGMGREFLGSRTTNHP